MFNKKNLLIWRTSFELCYFVISISYYLYNNRDEKSCCRYVLPIEMIIMMNDRDEFT